MNLKFKTSSILILGVAQLLLLSTCGGRSIEGPDVPAPSIVTDPEELLPLQTPPDDGLLVVATTNIVADIVANVGGEWVQLETLIPAGSDPHAYEPGPGDISAIAGADVIFINGFGLEEPLMDLLANAGGPVISLSDGIKGRNFTVEELGEVPGDDEVRAGALDPHVWFDPGLMEHWVERIRETFGGLDPEHARTYTGNSVNYLEQLRDLDRWIEEKVAAIPEDRRLLVTDHLVFGYFADSYGFEMVGAIIPAASTLAEPSARELAQLEDQISAMGIKAVFIGTAANPTLAETIAADTGVQLVELYTGSLGPPGSPAGDYLGFMRYNVIAIVDSLKD